jgi:drug/metabolite transporter (DMT)-like permease
MASISLSRAFAAPRLAPAVQGLLWGGVAVSIWGVYLAFARANVSAGIHPADLALVRYATAGMIMLPWLLRHAPAMLTSIGWRRAAVLTLLAGPLFILVSASGFAFAPLSHGAVVQPAVITIAGLALGEIMLGDRLTRPQIIGAGVILVGLALVAGPGALVGGTAALPGDALFATAGLMWAGFAVLSRRWSIAPLAATAVVSVLSALVYVPAYLMLRDPAVLLALPRQSLLDLALVHGALSGVVAVFAFGRAVELLGAPRAAAFPALVPVIATLVGIPLAGELPTMLALAGLGVVTLGLLITQRSRSLRSSGSPSPANQRTPS